MLSGFSARVLVSVRIGLVAFICAGCANGPQPRNPGHVPGYVPAEPKRAASGSSRSAADRAAEYAAGLVGARYRYGGSAPTTGFDCSGLVQFSYQQAGRAVPRTTELQRQASRPVRLSDLRRGDLLFFDQEGRKNSHVGIYVGNGQFVHAPSSGKRVRSDRLAAPYWRKHVSEARRLDV